MIDAMLTLALEKNEVPPLFPFPFSLHLLFCFIASAYLIIRFMYQKQQFQIIMATDIIFSLTIWISNSRTWFYALGIIEVALILLAFISTFFSKSKPEENVTPETDGEQTETEVQESEGQE